jgi:methionine-S-sulfoxide reductase
MRIFPFVMLFFVFTSCGQQVNGSSENLSKKVATNLDTIVLGGGCYWCVEAPFEQMKGVESVESGFTGGKTVNPSYEEVCTGQTGHAEVVRVIYDTTIVNLPTLLSVFFTVHDPTQLNRQGADVGTQYRSVIFYSADSQKLLASKIIASLDQSGAYPSKIVTTLEKLLTFYSAEQYHQNYYQNNPNQAYCRYVIQPKMDKFKKVFESYLK